jgi:hypothetical protein
MVSTRSHGLQSDAFIRTCVRLWAVLLPSQRANEPSLLLLLLLLPLLLF